MLTALVIPADINQPLRLEFFEKSDLPTYQQIVGGLIEHVGLERPTASMYMNEEGKAHGLPSNPRATVLLSVHNIAFLGRDVIAGDAFILGPPDSEGNDTSAPDDLVQLLMRTSEYETQIKTVNDSTWSGNHVVYKNWYDAYIAVVRLALRWTLVEQARVIPHEGKDVQRLKAQWLAIGRENPWIREADDPPFRLESFYPCYTVEELQERLTALSWCIGAAFYYRDLCFIQQVEAGDEWLTIRHGIAFESISVRPFIERGEFAALVRRLLSATAEQCKALEY